MENLFYLSRKCSVTHDMLLIVVLVVLGILPMRGMAQTSHFRHTRSGLQYRFLTRTFRGPHPQDGEVLVGKLVLCLDDDTLINTQGRSERMVQVSRESVLYAGLVKMRVGDHVLLRMPVDSCARQWNKMPDSYRAGTGQYIIYDIELDSIVGHSQLEKEAERYQNRLVENNVSEPMLIAQYVRENGITVEPTASGLYVVVRQLGDGPVVSAGCKVEVDYVGRFLDGSVFDSSRESVAREAGIWNAARTYAPLCYTVGTSTMIEGWEEGLSGLPEGTVVTLLMPSSLAYGARGVGRYIPPYTPLVFDVEIIAVRGEANE